MPGHDSSGSRRKRHAQEPHPGDARPPGKKQHAAADAPRPSEQERIRSAVRDLYASYQALINAPSGSAADAGAFQALLRASQGDAAAQRLAARLVPRFIASFPDQADAAAAVLTRLHDRTGVPDGHNKALEEQTRRDALLGLAAVLSAAPPGAAGAPAVKRVLGVLFSLLPQVEAEEGPQEPEEPAEEGEVTATPDKTLAQGPWVRRMLRRALSLHPTTVLGACVSSLSATGGRGSGSAADPALPGVRLWLKGYLLREAGSSRESTPLGGEHGSGGGGLAASNGAAAGGRKGAPAAGASAAARGCLLQAALESSQELQGWVMQQARGRATAPPEVRSLLETALQLLPAHQQLAAAKPQLLDARPPHGRPGGGWERSPLQPTPAQQQQQQAPPNGALLNGMEQSQLGRSWSTPSSFDRSGGRAGRPGHGKPYAGPPGSNVRPQFPAAAGPVCRVEACLLAANVPRHVSRADVQADLGADEVWLLDPLPGSGGAGACCVYATVLDAAKAYLRHHGARRFGAQHAPVSLAFTDALPSCSRAAAGGAQQASPYVWATRGLTADAETITDQLREAGLQLMHAHRVNNAVDPGTLLHTPSAKHAADIVRFLLHTYPAAAAAAAAAAEQAGGGELPPLPPEPPPGDAAGGSGRSSPAAPGSAAGPPPPQQLPPGYTPAQAFRRTSSVPVPSSTGAGQRGAPGSGWRDSPGGPGDFTTPPVPQHREGGSRWGPSLTPQQQQQMQQAPFPQPPPWQQQGASPGQLDPAPAARHPWQHGTSPQQQQAAAAAPPPHHSRWGAPHGALPPAPPLGGPPPPHQQAAAAMRSHPALAAAAAGGGGGSPAGPVPPLPPPLPGGPGPGGANHHAGPGQQPPPGAGPGPGPGAPPGRLLWQGSLAKQAVRLCSVVCLDGGSGQRAPGLAPEPRHWPEQLQVNYRISVGDALEQYAAAPPGQRAVRLLAPLDPGGGDAAQLQGFIEYLNSKQRAGMVKLPALRDAGLGPRALYLLVPRSNVCHALHVTWDGRSVMLIAVVVPQPGPPGGSGGGGGGSGGGGSAHRHPR